MVACGRTRYCLDSFISGVSGALTKSIQGISLWGPLLRCQPMAIIDLLPGRSNLFISRLLATRIQLPIHASHLRLEFNTASLMRRIPRQSWDKKKVVHLTRVKGFLSFCGSNTQDKAEPITLLFGLGIRCPSIRM